ncbi:hypothetical protein [Absidia glauca]|uniref:HSF-type DNA-binding domain-containing protein n=1 Tax=Absidia glauca TaxID=4829 RepID=A0A163JR03_ABSGL|nr:hypothetical protein [Absidia glauca]
MIKSDFLSVGSTLHYLAPTSHPISSKTENDGSRPHQRAHTNIPEFVKKLFSMLEDNDYPSILTWGLEGKTFIVIEPTEFSKLILPQHFKHGNFASFVRQLNKYDFHKIRHQNDAWPYGNQAWEFYHSHFQYKQKDLLKGIKRKPTNHTSNRSSSSQTKPPTQKSVLPSTTLLPASSSSSISSSIGSKNPSDDIRALSQQIIEIQESQMALTNKLRSLAHRHEFVVETVSTFQKSMTAQDDFIHSIVQARAKNNITGPRDDPLLLQLSSPQEQDQLARITKYVEQQQQQLSPYLKSSDQGALLPPPVLVPPSINPLRRDDDPSRWSTHPRILLAVSNKENHSKVIQNLIYQWLVSFGCLIESKSIDSLVDPFHNANRYDLLFVDEDLLSANFVMLTAMRQAHPWIPLISLCKEISEQLFLDWIKHGVTDVLSRPFDQKAVYNMVEKYCSHLKLA